LTGVLLLPLSRQFSTETPEETQFWLETILHSLDIGNVAWPWEQASRWARMVGTEFKLQVVREQEAGIPVSEYMKIPHNMYEESVLPKLAGGQIGFANFIVKPCLEVRTWPAPVPTLLNSRCLTAARAMPAENVAQNPNV